MSNNSVIKIVVILVLLLPVTNGCIHQLQEWQVPQEKKGSDIPSQTLDDMEDKKAVSLRDVEKIKSPLPPPLSADMVEKKITYLNDIIKTEHITEEDRKVALCLLSAYRKSKLLANKKVTDNDLREMIKTLFSNLSYLDQQYFSSERNKNLYSKGVALFLVERVKILDHFISGEYQEVINSCHRLISQFGADAVTPEIGVFLATSLTKQGKIHEAVNIGEKVLGDMDRWPDAMQLRADIARWQFDLGNKQKALDMYEKLVDEMEDRNIVIAKTREYIEDEQIKVVPDNIPGDDESTPKGDTDITDEPSTNVLKSVDQLINERNFEEARLLLIKEKIRLQDDSGQVATIDEAIKTVEIAEEQYQVEKDTALSHEATLEMASRLIEKEEYEEAIVMLGKIPDTSTIASEAKEIKTNAITKLIKKERIKAANNYLMAKKTADVDEKKKLLALSYNILQSLIDNYPSSRMIPQLKDHLKTVKQELDKINMP